MTTSTPYDETPYPSGPYQQTHPERLEALARFFGLSAPDIRACRVLELGAADASNLLPMAIAHPESRFVGIDLSQRHVHSGQETIAALSLGNLELLHLDVLDIDARFGTFDYVIVHGVYSWVPAHVQEHILEICSANLAPNGVAYVSYNTNPGWRMRGLLRDMMLYHARKFDDVQMRVDQARALVQWLAATVDPEGNPYGMLLKRELDQMRTWPDAYFRHDSLGEINEPVYFHEFIERAERHGLQYLAEADLTQMLASNYAPPIDAALNQMGRDIIELEQYMDFLRNRLFRQTLLCHRGIRLNRALGAWSLEGFHVASPLQPAAELDLAPNVSVKFKGPRNLTVSSDDPIVKAALACLSDVWPRSVHIDELLRLAKARVPESLHSESAGDVLGGALLSCCTKGLCELHVHRSITFVREPSERPSACPVVRWQAANGDPVTNRRHERVFLDELAKRLLPLLDGLRDRAALLQSMAAWFAEETITLDEDLPSLEPSRVREALARKLEHALGLYGRQALLVS